MYGVFTYSICSLLEEDQSVDNAFKGDIHRLSTCINVYVNVLELQIDISMPFAVPPIYTCASYGTGLIYMHRRDTWLVYVSILL